MPKFDLAGHRKIWFLISALIIIPGIICMFVRGFNFGIDFTGGTIIDLKFAQPVTIAEVRTSLAKYGLDGSTIQLSGAQSDVTSSEDVMIRTTDLEEEQRKEVMATLKQDVGDYTVLREEKVGATIGGELITNALEALVISWALIILYVAYRFEWKFGVAAIIANLHDVVIILGFFAFFQWEFSLSVLAGVLAVLGIVFLRPVAVLLGAKGELLDYAVRYGRILMLALPPFALQNMFQSFFVTAEKPLLGFWFTVGAGCTNMVL
ncbi:MAG TPA: hypothetical protein DD660_00625, partial [Mitsuokella multacida]|nr:hypothetical protein [Mitsuokella multacida]